MSCINILQRNVTIFPKAQSSYKKLEPKIFKKSTGKRSLSQKVQCAIAVKLRFITEQVAIGLLIQLGVKIPLGKILFLEDILFWKYKNEVSGCVTRVNKSIFSV